MSEPNLPISPAFAIFKKHEVSLLASQMFGVLVGNMLDSGLSDMEVLTVTEEFCKIIRSAVKDKKLLSGMMKEQNLLRRHIENPDD
jgi:hypothetical protein